MEVQKGDVIVMGSDGLFDNVFDHEIVSIVTKHADVAESCMYMYIPSLLILNLKLEVTLFVLFNYYSEVIS